jgi:hypothetical protein
MSIKYKMMAAAVLCCAAMPFVALADDCDAVKTAIRASWKTPHRFTTGVSIDGKPAPSQGETVFTGTATYSRVDGGAWKKKAFSLEKTLAESYATLANARCRKILEEDVNGIKTAIYSIQMETGQKRSVWVSQRDGWILQDMVGSGKVVVHWSFRYDGDNRPPAGAR